MRRFSSLSLGIKLTALIFTAFGLFLISNIVLLIFNTQAFTEEVGDERIQEAAITVQNELTNIQDLITTDMNVLVTDILFFQAVGRRNADDVQNILARTNLDLELYDVLVVDGDGNSLFANDDHLAIPLLPQEVSENPISYFFQDEDELPSVHIAWEMKIVSVTGNVLGAIRVSRHLDEPFLNLLIGEQRRVLVGVVYDGEFSSRSEAFPSIVLDTDALNATITTLTETLIVNNTPYKGAYLPQSLYGKQTPVSLVVMTELSELYSFQNRMLINTIGIFALIIAITTLVMYAVLYRIVVNPISRLRSIALEMTGGQYDRRIPVTNHDELGELALTFNAMATAVQQREAGLQEALLRAERSDQVKSAFLASMSHELRTPLNAVINFTKFVAKGDLGPVNADQKETLDEVVNSAKHLLNLINDVLDMSKIESGSLNLFVVDDVDMKAIVNQAVTMGKALLENKSVQIQVQMADELPLIRGDRHRLTQVLLNIMSNACKFTERGSISLTAKRTADDVVVAIKDTGPGIAPEDHHAVFEAFKQTTTGLRKGGGTGLGMPITKSLIEAHGGSITLDSKPDEGTTFTVTLPIQSELLVPTHVGKGAKS